MKSKRVKSSWYGEVMRDLRLSRGLTQSDVARGAKVDVDTVGRIETGLSSGRFDFVEKIFNALDHDIEVVPIDAKSESYKR